MCPRVFLRHAARYHGKGYHVMSITVPGFLAVSCEHPLVGLRSPSEVAGDRGEEACTGSEEQKDENRAWPHLVVCLDGPQTTDKKDGRARHSVQQRMRPCQLHPWGVVPWRGAVPCDV